MPTLIQIQLTHAIQQTCAVCHTHIYGIPDRPARQRRLLDLKGNDRFDVCCCCLRCVSPQQAIEGEYRDRWVEWIFQFAPYCVPVSDCDDFIDAAPDAVLSTSDPDLVGVVLAWPHLSPDEKTAITTLINSHRSI